MIPRFWMYETTGVLRPAVEAYLAGGELSDHQAAAIRAYLRQWIMSPAWDRCAPGADLVKWLADLRARCDALTSRAAIRQWLHDAFEGGMDPL